MTTPDSDDQTLNTMRFSLTPPNLSGTMKLPTPHLQAPVLETLELKTPDAPQIAKQKNSEPKPDHKNKPELITWENRDKLPHYSPADLAKHALHTASHTASHHAQSKAVANIAVSGDTEINHYKLSEFTDRQKHELGKKELEKLGGHNLVITSEQLQKAEKNGDWKLSAIGIDDQKNYVNPTELHASTRPEHKLKQH